MNKSYFEMSIAFNESNSETIYNRLYMEGITTILEETGVLKIYLNSENEDKLHQIKKNLIETEIISETNIRISKFDNQDWNKEWEQTIEPVIIKDKIIIYPSWKKSSLKNTVNKILIQIDPKMSFGTGHNETTQLILELMSDYIAHNDKFMLDYGCGTGILAIAGIKLGVEKAIAIDIDEDAIENAKECFEQNNVDKYIILYQKDISQIDENSFDVISANITSNVIIPKLKDIYNKLKSNGKVFITGILVEEKVNLIHELKKNNFEIKDIRDKAEWTSFYAIKK